MEVDPQRAAELIRAGEVQVVDVREPYEHAAGHIDGATHIPLSQLGGAAGRLDRETPILFYCRVGMRSLMAAQAFAGAGFEAVSISGGLVAWDRAGLPLAPEGGTVADH